MKKIAIFTTLHERPIITEIMMHGIERMRVQYSDIFDFRVWAIGHQPGMFGPMCEHFNVNFVTSAREDLLGAKVCSVVKRIMNDWPDFDYLMKMDTDDLVTHKMLEHWHDLIVEDTPFFGSKDKYLVDVVSWRCKHFTGYPNTSMGVSGGKMMRRDLVKKLNGDICKSYIKHGIDYSIKLQMQKVRAREKLITTGGNIELKSSVNIHGYDHNSLQGEPVERSQFINDISKVEARMIGAYSLIEMYRRREQVTGPLYNVVFS